MATEIAELATRKPEDREQTAFVDAKESSLRKVIEKFKLITFTGEILFNSLEELP